MNSSVPDLRLRRVNDASVHSDAAFVLYWMTGYRRLSWNWALDRAVEWSRELGLPLVIFEPLRCDYRWVSARHHRFVMDGMRDHRTRTRELETVVYYPWVETEQGGGKGLLKALAKRAALVVTDDVPYFFYPRMMAAAGEALPVALEAVDSNGILPLAQPGRDFTVAHSFRRHLHKVLLEHIHPLPSAHPFQGGLADPGTLGAGLGGENGEGGRGTGPDPLADILERWPAAPDALLESDGVGELPIPAEPSPVPLAGGPVAAAERMESFFADRYPRYADERNDPDRDAGSGLSPYLHWGHISAHELFHRVVEREGWTPAQVNDDFIAKQEGWWGMSAPGEAFLEELLTWREIGYHEYWRRGQEAESFDSLPGWARTTLEEHAGDSREYVYTLEEFDAAETHDPLWNAAQRELRIRGVIHNYLRMLWGKKILEWSASPRDARDILFELNNRYAIDGRDATSTSGIMWVLGRYDRAWGERPVYGKVRSMSSDSTRRKVKLDRYLERFGPDSL